MNEKYMFTMPRDQAIKDAVETIEKAFKIGRAELLQALDAQCVKHGRWTDHHCTHIEQLDANFIQAKCICCGRYSDKIDSFCRYLDLEYCSHCGARMDGDAK